MEVVVRAAPRLDVRARTRRRRPLRVPPRIRPSASRNSSLRAVQPLELGLVDAQRPQPRRPAPSSSARTAYASLISRGVSPRTSAPRFGRSSTRPLAWSLRSASRIGVRLTPNSSASASCRSRVPGGRSPLEDTRLQLMASLSTSARRSSIAWAITVDSGRAADGGRGGMTARDRIRLDTFDDKLDTSLESGFSPSPESPFPFTEGRLR